MTPRCIITGCDMVFEDTGTLYHGDLFEMGPLYIFNAVIHNGEPLALNRLLQDKYLAMPSLGSGYDYFERRGVFVIPKTTSTLSRAAKEYIHAP